MKRQLLSLKPPGCSYDDAIKGFQEGCKDNGITVRDIYDLNGDAETGKKGCPWYQKQ